MRAPVDSLASATSAMASWTMSVQRRFCGNNALDACRKQIEDDHLCQEAAGQVASRKVIPCAATLLSPWKRLDDSHGHVAAPDTLIKPGPYFQGFQRGD
jgi:hypothetical protein